MSASTRYCRLPDAADMIASSTAETFQKLASLRGVSASITFDAERGVYLANGASCGPSVHGLYEWLATQPKVKP
jgi:hypothetical protein